MHQYKGAHTPLQVYIPVSCHDCAASLIHGIPSAEAQFGSCTSCA